MYTACILTVAPLPRGFNFNYLTTEIGTALIPPKSNTGGGIAPRFPDPAITPQDIIEVQAGRKFLYLSGWARYLDVFPDTPEHVTKFCWQITPLGNPLTFNPAVTPQTLTFPNVLHTEGNCADDECDS
jgi:hypothetical protein